MRNAESDIVLRKPGKKSGIHWKFGIRNPEAGIKGLEFGSNRKESGIQNPRKGIQNPRCGARNPTTVLLYMGRILTVKADSAIHPYRIRTFWHTSQCGLTNTAT